MSDILDKSIRLKNKIERMKEDRIKSEGALEQLMAQMKSEYGCKSLEEAEAEITKLQKLIKKSKDKIVEEHNRLEKELNER